ncbi:MAG: tetratricopeptide repeat protein [Geminicoccaceae bacterium]
MLDAYQLMIRGLKHLHRINPGDLAIARRYFEAALALEPGQYFLTICLSWIDATAIGNGWPPSRPDALEHCIAVMREVVRRHDRSAHAHRLMGRLASLKGDHAEALAQSERAWRLNPYNSDMMANHGYILARSGRAGEGLPLAERALAINPYAPTYYRSYLGLSYFLAGRYAEGVEVLSAVEGTVGPSRVARAANLAALGRIEEARAEARLVTADADFDLDRLIAGLQLASAADRERLVDALRLAGIG